MPHKIMVEEKTITFLDQDKNILNTLEKANIETHYHCRDGYCGACRCKLIHGEVEYPLEPLAYIGEGEILTCCARPKTDIKIDISN